LRSILVVSGSVEGRQAISDSFQSQYQVDVVASLESGPASAPGRRYEFIFIDLDWLPGVQSGNGQRDYRTALQRLWQTFPGAEVVVLASQDRVREGVKAVKAGASNYLTYPVNADEVRYVKESIEESLRLQWELDYLRDSFWQYDSLGLVRTHNAAMQQLFNKIRSVAKTQSTVLLTGETGTGKGVLARLIHRHSERAQNQFISVHCGAIPDGLLESELFGHEKGAFTGAVRRKLGKFEIARGGTLFLDEIGTISPATQIKLLQVLQERTIQRVGGEEIIATDVRIIAATNADLRRMVGEGSFRSDLYYRLNVFPIEIPPLRERTEDIPLLVEAFLKRLNQFHSKRIVAVSPEVMEAFSGYPWPGNIRELENLVERAYILETTSMLTPESFPGELFADGSRQAHLPLDITRTLAEVRRIGTESLERHYLKELLGLHQGRIDKTARAAGITTRQLHKLMTKYGLRKEEFKSHRGLGALSEPIVLTGASSEPQVLKYR
jgi:DNA-binding NtrC family response regulator